MKDIIDICFLTHQIKRVESSFLSPEEVWPSLFYLCEQWGNNCRNSNIIDARGKDKIIHQLPCLQIINKCEMLHFPKVKSYLVTLPWWLSQNHPAVSEDCLLGPGCLGCNTSLVLVLSWQHCIQHSVHEIADEYLPIAFPVIDKSSEM